jgi:N-acetyl-anhydromuramyl-L-alanine amidase AmpD
MANEIKAREVTKIILVHFTGDPGVTFNQVSEDSRSLGHQEPGIHFVIERDGKLLMGRHQSKVGFHYPEYDAISVGILVAAVRDDMNEAQSIALILLLDKLQMDYPSIESIKYIYRSRS